MLESAWEQVYERLVKSALAHVRGRRPNVWLARLIFLSLGAALLEMGCKKEASVQSILSGASAGPANNTNYTEDAVKRIVVPGASKSNIDTAFGIPLNVRSVGNGQSVAIYEFPDGSFKRGFSNKFNGFEATYKDGLALNWVPIYSSHIVSGEGFGTPHPIQADKNSSGSNAPTPTLAFYLAYDSVVSRPNDTNVTDEVKIRAGLAHPEVTLTNISAAQEAMGNSEKEQASSKAHAITIQLNRSDTEIFKQFSERNVGQSVIMTFDREPIMTRSHLINSTI